MVVLTRRLSFRKVLFIITIACVLFIPSSSTEITKPIRDGEYIYIDDSKTYLKSTYEATHGEDIEHWAMTKTFTGNCDMAIGFDGEVAWPTKVLLNDPHYIYWDTNESKTFYYVTNFIPTTGSQDYGNWYNPLKYKFDHKIYIGYDNVTNESIWQDVVGTVAYFDSQINDGTNYTVKWHTEHSQLEQYRDISDRILANPVNYEYDGKNLWFVTKNIHMTAGVMRKIVIEMDGRIELGEHSYKYDIIWKPSSQTIAEARTAGNLYVLDPYWNTSWSSYSTVTMNATAPEDNFQVRFTNATFTIPLTMWNEMNQDGNDTRILNYNHTIEFPHWIEHLTARDNYSIWVNVTDNASATYQWYYGNPSASSTSDGNATFPQYYAGGSTTNGVAVYPDNTKSFAINDYAIRVSASVSSASAQYAHPFYMASHSSVPYTDPYLTHGIAGGTNSHWRYAGGTVDYGYAVDTNSHIYEAYGNSTSMSGFIDDDEEVITTGIPSTWYFAFRVDSGGSAQTLTIDWGIVRKYIANEPIATDISEPRFYVDSLHYNSTSPYNHTIESDGTLTSNRSIVAGDDTNWTANSTGTTYWQHTTEVNTTGHSNFTISGDNLDNFTSTNLTTSSTYTLSNSSGTVEHQTTDSDGTATFEANIVAGDYWVEYTPGVLIVTFLSMTPSEICQNCTGNISICYGISHSSVGLNNTSVSFIYRNYDYDLSDSNHSIRPPANNLAAVWNFNGKILRAANRNETVGRLNFEDNATITGGDTYTWSGLDENHTRLTIVPVNSTYTKVYINGTIHDVMPQMHYIDRSDLQEAPKTQLAIHKTQNVLVKFWNFEIFKGNYDFLGVGYTDTDLESNPALHPSDADPINYYYVNSSYNPATGGDPLISGYAVYMGSLNASEWVDHVHSPHPNSSYVRGFINNTLLHSYINTTNISYLYFTSNTPSSKPFYINVTDVATSTNVSFADTNVLWAGDTPPYAQQSFTPNVWFAFMKLNMSFDHKLYVADNIGQWANSTMNRTNITTGLFPPTKPSFYAFHNGFQDFDMNGTYHNTIQIQVSAGSDPDGGVVTHNITLHYGNKTYVATINDSVVAEDGVYTNVSFNTTPYYSQTENYTLRVIATDDEGENVTVWLGVNFSLDGSPRIISYSPGTPVTSIRGDTQTFTITTNLLGNVTWYLDNVEVFNETSVNYSSYSNSTAPIGTYNVTVTTTNINGTNSMTWGWEVEDPILAALLQLQSDIDKMKRTQTIIQALIFLVIGVVVGVVSKRRWDSKDELKEYLESKNK